MALFYLYIPRLSVHLRGYPETWRVSEDKFNCFKWYLLCQSSFIKSSFPLWTSLFFWKHSTLPKEYTYCLLYSMERCWWKRTGFGCCWRQRRWWWVQIEALLDFPGKPANNVTMIQLSLFLTTLTKNTASFSNADSQRSDLSFRWLCPLYFRRSEIFHLEEWSILQGKSYLYTWKWQICKNY